MLTALFALVHSATALANTYCAPSASASSSCDAVYPTVQEALDAAAANPAEDTVSIGPGVFSGPFTYLKLDALHLTGSGRGATTLTAPAGTPTSVLFVLTARIGLASTVSDLAIDAPTSGAFLPALSLSGADARRVDVTGGAADSTGVGLDSGATFNEGSVSLPIGAGTSSVGVQVYDTGGIFDSRVSAQTGLQTGASSSGEVDIVRSEISAACGIYAAAGVTDVQSSVFRLQDTGCHFLGPTALFVLGGTINANHLTIEGYGAPGATGAFVYASAPSESTRLTLRNSIIHGTAYALDREAFDGDAEIETDYSNYDPRTNYDLNQSPGTGAITETHPLNVDPQFANLALGDFHVANAQLIDAGDPAGLAPGESPIDVSGTTPRILDGDGDCVARRDIGAVEHWSPAGVVAKVAVSPEQAETGQVVTFDGTGSCDSDPAGVLKYEWSFDDGTGARGAIALHSFSTPGDHMATLTVTGSNGAGSTFKRILVRPAQSRGEPASEPRTQTQSRAPDKTPPVARRLEVRPKRFAAARAGSSIARVVGAAVRYRLSERATVRFTIERLRKGRTCRTSNRNGAASKRCRRFKRLSGGFTHNGRMGSNKLHFTGRLAEQTLKPGSYRLVATPTDGAGNGGGAVSARFRIVEETAG